MQGDWTGAIERAQEHAPFLARLLDVQPDLHGILAEGEIEQALQFARQAGKGARSVASALRREKMALALALAIGDLAGVLPLARVVNELSSFADRALDQAIAEAIRNRMPDAEPKGFFALALGKHGAGELNYSSDIDPILLFDPERLPRRARDEPGEAAQRVARRVVDTLGKFTEEGYVFRVDLRLRPASEVSPLAISCDAAMTHYESSALAWERAAFIRARACSGELAAGEQFLDAIRPFIWRRSLDFNALEDIRRLTLRIREAYDGPTDPSPGFDVKKGRGGIREVEFFAQTHQLIHGGRKPSLRLRGTRETLDSLAREGVIASGTAEQLGRAYDRLRVVEHRLQMVADQQTHSLPDDEVALDAVARLDGLESGAALIAELGELTAVVGRHFDRLLDQGGSAENDMPIAHGPSLKQGLSDMGFDAPGRLAERIANWSDGRVRALRSDAARAAFDAVAPTLFAAIAKAPEQQRAFNRFESLLTNLPSAVNLFRLLEARPGLMDQLIAVLTLAPPLAEELARRPDLLDTLIDKSAFDLPGAVDQLAARIVRGQADDDYEGTLDHLRRIVGELRFTMGVQLVNGVNDPLDIARGLSRVAEAALQVSARAASAEFADKHGRIADDDLMVLGLGRLGGGALTHASDLDLVYLFNGEGGGVSDGAKPLSPALYFNRLAQRVSGALSVPTAEGALYEVDTRLRPQGNQGPLAVNLASFRDYQMHDAWTWEHMALTRARPVYGSDEARARLQAVIDEVLAVPRDAEVLQSDLLKMRAEMAAHKAPRGSLDVKLLRGGLVDCEFIVHFLQLRENAGLFPDLHQAIAALVAEGVLPAAFAQAHDTMSRLLVAARLLAPAGQLPSSASQIALVTACGAKSTDALLQSLAHARHEVALAWQTHFYQNLEIET